MQKNESKTTTLTLGDHKFLQRVEDQALNMFGSIDTEQMFRTFRAIKSLGYPVVELRDAEELFDGKAN